MDSMLSLDSILSMDSISSMFSPLLTTATGRSHQGLHGSFSSGMGDCCPPVFDPSTLFALIAGIALATYFLRLVIVVTTFGGRAFPEPWLLFAQNGLHSSEEKFEDLENVSEAIYENSVDSKEEDSWPGWVGGLVAELLELYKQETEDMEEEETSIRDGEKSKLNSSSSLGTKDDKAREDTYEAPVTSSSSSS